jgi:hypothetical protein
LNTVPFCPLPPEEALPYNVLPDKMGVTVGLPPSLPPLKLCNVAKPEPSVLRANTVP